MVLAIILGVTNVQADNDGVNRRGHHMRSQYIRDLADLNCSSGEIDQRIAIAVICLQADQKRDSTAVVASAVRCLEPALVPGAAGLWLHNLMLLVR